jgi:uncharacterized protein
MNPSSLRTLLTSRGHIQRLRSWSVLVLGIVGVLVLQSVWPDSILSRESLGLDGPVVLFVLLSAMFCEYIDSTLGMGYGTTLTPVLLLAGFAPLQIVPAVLLSEFLTGLAAGLFHHRDGNVDLLRDRRVRRTVIWLGLLSLAGTLAAVTVAVRVSQFWLTLIIASIVCSVGLLILATVKRQLLYRPGHIIALGAVASFNKALSGGGYGPLVTGGQLVFGISSKNAVAITCIAESFTCAVGLIAYLVMRQPIYWPLALPLVTGALLSVPVATLTVRKMPDRFLRRGVGITTCVLGVVMLVKVLA